MNSNILKKLFLLSGIAFLFLCPSVSFSQIVTADTLRTENTDTPSNLDSLPPHSPKMAALYSTFLPGLGQVYNKKYWKIPIIYAGLIGLGYNIGYNQRQYNLYREEFIYRIESGDKKKLHVNHYEIYRTTTANLPIVQDSYRKNRDLFVIGTLVFYVINIIDASVDAHLFHFDVSEDLSLNLSPDLNYCFASRQSVPSLSFKLKF
ncbi:MAG: hypothetical protein H0X62_13385 [Bacteroidetes bacterium]|nr:hypothetical protein [Bacteroidota bacterium]